VIVLRFYCEAHDAVVRPLHGDEDAPHLVPADGGGWRIDLSDCRCQGAMAGEACEQWWRVMLIHPVT
jgi:hypothetical protein